MCGIAGVIYKDKKTHPVGEALTSMLESLQHRGPDSAGYAIYGSLDFPENYYQLNIEVKRKRGALDNLKSLLNQISPIFEEQLIESVGDSDVYKCKIALDEFSLLKPCINEIDDLENVRVINGSHSFEMIKDTGKVKDIAKRFDVPSRMGTHGIGHTRFATESGVDRYHAHPYQSYIIPDITVVHNGQITNYWKIRDPLERKGHTFESFNDTECIVHYMADKLDQGYKLEEALDAEGFEMTAFLSERKLTLNGSNDTLTTKLSNLVGVDGDMGSFDSALDKLVSMEKYYQHRRGSGGVIDTVKAEISNIDAEIFCRKARIAFYHCSHERKTTSFTSKRTITDACEVGILIEAFLLIDGYYSFVFHLAIGRNEVSNELTSTLHVRIFKEVDFF